MATVTPLLPNCGCTASWALLIKKRSFPLHKIDNVVANPMTWNAIRMALNSYQSVLVMQSFKSAKPMPPVDILAISGVMPIADKSALLSAYSMLSAPGANVNKNYLGPISIIHTFSCDIVYRNSNVVIQDQCNSQSNMRFERIADAGHGSCGASPAPKAHQFPHSAVGVVRRSAQARRYISKSLSPK